jgi:hypothetical protein
MCIDRWLRSACLLVLSFFPFSGFAATCNSQNGTLASPSSWSSSSTWSCGSIPGSGDATSISHYVNNGSLTLNGNYNITINAGGTLRINGDLTLGSNVTITIAGGTLEVTGALTLNNGATITASSGNISVSGAVTLSNNNSTINFNSTGTISIGSLVAEDSGSGKEFNINAGTLTATGTVAIGNNTTLFIDDDAAFNGTSLSTADRSSAYFKNEGVSHLTGTVTQSGPIINYSTGTLTIDTDLSGQSTGNAVFSNYGYLTVKGNASYPNNATFTDYAGGTAVFQGNFTAENTQALTIGTSAAAPPYADVIIQGNLVANSSGDVLVDVNGRLGVFGDINASTSDGTHLTINSGGQIYVDGDGSGSSINFKASSGSDVDNNNTNVTYNGNSTPWGFYVNGDMANESGSSDQPANVAELQGSNPDFYAWVLLWSTGSFSTLPVSLISFTARTTSDGVTLMWSTSVEKNFDHFILEKSADGIFFFPVSSIKGRGFSEVVNNYNFTDNAPVAGGTYYRLSSLDFDGYTETLKVIYIDHKNDNSISLFPNLVNVGEPVNLLINFVPGSADKVAILNYQGLHQDAELNTYVNVLTFNATFEPGYYIVTYVSGTHVYRSKLIVK